MERREFLKVIAGFPLFAVARLGQAGPKPRRIVLQESPLAGYQFHEGPRVWKRLKVGDSLTLVREPDNPYDDRAVRVEWRDHKIGYLPRVENAVASQLLDRGAHLTACIAGLREDRDPWSRVKVQVFLEHDGETD